MLVVYRGMLTPEDKLFLTLFAVERPDQDSLYANILGLLESSDFEENIIPESLRDHISRSVALLSLYLSIPKGIGTDMHRAVLLSQAQLSLKAIQDELSLLGESLHTWAVGLNNALELLTSEFKEQSVTSRSDAIQKVLLNPGFVRNRITDYVEYLYVSSPYDIEFGNEVLSRLNVILTQIINAIMGNKLPELIPNLKDPKIYDSDFVTVELIPIRELLHRIICFHFAYIALYSSPQSSTGELIPTRVQVNELALSFEKILLDKTNKQVLNDFFRTDEFINFIFDLGSRKSNRLPAVIESELKGTDMRRTINALRGAYNVMNLLRVTLPQEEV